VARVHVIISSLLFACRTYKADGVILRGICEALVKAIQPLRTARLNYSRSMEATYPPITVAIEGLLAAIGDTVAATGRDVSRKHRTARLKASGGRTKDAKEDFVLHLSLVISSLEAVRDEYTVRYILCTYGTT
jgi:hypothetical protein